MKRRLLSLIALAALIGTVMVAPQRLAASDGPYAAVFCWDNYVDDTANCWSAGGFFSRNVCYMRAYYAYADCIVTYW